MRRDIQAPELNSEGVILGRPQDVDRPNQVTVPCQRKPRIAARSLAKSMSPGETPGVYIGRPYVDAVNEFGVWSQEMHAYGRFLGRK